MRFLDYLDDSMERAKANLLSHIGRREEHFSIYVQGNIYPNCQILWDSSKWQLISGGPLAHISKHPKFCSKRAS